MSEINPYKPPESQAAAAAGASDFIADGRAVDSGRGWEWIASGWELFKKQPGTWILLLIVLLVCSILISLVPLIGGLANMLLLQVFMGGVMLGCRALDVDGSLELGHLFAGFKQNTSDLVVLGVLALVAWVIIIIPALVIVGGGSFMAMMRGDAMGMAAFGMTFVLAMLVVLALSIPVYMALWFAPSLIVFHGLKPVAAMKTSFFACLKNIVPFLLYGVILLVLSLVAAIPLGLGFLVLAPVIMASIYAAYRDIFFAG
ncbi:MAG: hypothetical protein HY525_00185 [Betaproteobacteria bacterium]|nr:hypothetical protein [Betaproteobacteria bacterium]